MYQIIDAIRTARAIQAGEPIPDPFGLASTFGTGEKIETTKVPAAAAILIGLGVLFLVNTVFDFSLHRFWPIILIVLGVWLFAKHWGLLGGYRPYCVCEHCRTRKLMGPAILVTLGRAIPAGQCVWRGVSPNLAGDSAGDWSGQTVAKQCFV